MHYSMSSVYFSFVNVSKLCTYRSCCLYYYCYCVIGLGLNGASQLCARRISIHPKSKNMAMIETHVYVELLPEICGRSSSPLFLYAQMFVGMNALRARFARVHFEAHIVLWMLIKLLC